ncbi:hypothetical protein PCASD_17081 [Puccinia coronata f. sp. avenae]|uniref:Uncharacterized protein n=1 Tax=Puccinia coronata f. sp. avenae TaxID=200324 RepID=A0A2N5TR28_9BASI|nr:hypothetical protein PCASD_17081 [Puccinia coronata f. sp. avenae]
MRSVDTAVIRSSQAQLMNFQFFPTDGCAPVITGGPAQASTCKLPETAVLMESKPAPCLVSRLAALGSLDLPLLALLQMCSARIPTAPS